MILVRWANIWLTALGSLVFGALFLFVHASPVRFDRAVGDAVVSEVGDRLHAALPGLLDGSGVGGFAMDEVAARLPGQLGERVSAQVSTIEFLSEPEAKEMAGRILAEVCGCQSAGQASRDFEPVLDRVLVDAQADLVRTEERVRSFALGEYHAALSELRRDIGIFAGTTLVLFLAALFLGVFKSRASVHLLPASLALTLATLLTAQWYLFGQDWIMTLVLSSHWGMAYPVFAGFVSALLLDIALFRARATTFLLGALGPVFPGC